MMTIEEAIKYYEDSERNNRMLAGISVSALAKNHNLENAEKCRQMIEWLRELQERRKQPEIIYCKDCTYPYKRDGALLCPFVLTFAGDFFCGMAERRTDK